MSKMQKYSSYKDSGVEWLGEIPEHWEVQRLRTLGVFSASGIDKYINKNETIVKIINFTDVYSNIKRVLNNTIDFMEVTTPENNRKKHLVKKGDLIFLPSSETYEDLGLSALVDEELDNTSFSYHVIRLQFKKDIEHSFRKYLTNNNFVSNQFSSYGKGTTRKIIGRNVFNNIKIVLPLKEEQTKIASFLDEKTAQIDEAISQKEKLIELLKERKQIVINDAVTKGLDKNVEFVDSGVEWIGQIPKHWTKVKLKWISKIYAGGTPDKNNLRFWENGTIPWIASGEVNQEIVTKPTTNITEKGFKNSSARWIPKDSLIVALAGQGKTKGMVAYLAIDTTGNQSLSAVIPNKKKISSKYLYNFIKSAYKELRGSAGEGQRDGLNLEKLGVLDVVFPPKDEQIKIVEYIENQTTKIDIAIELQQKYISKLKEYKASLIDSVVTGKVKVS